MARTLRTATAEEPASPEIPKATTGVTKSGRPRGRPRKENKVVKVPSGRPRGRPKGTTKAAAISKALEATGASKEEIDAALAAQTPKKAPKGTGRRGRPPKSGATPSKTPTSASKTKAKSASTPNSTGRRGRGRPRRNVNATPSKEQPAEEEVKEDSEVGEDAEGESDTGVDAVAQPEDENELTDHDASD